MEFNKDSFNEQFHFSDTSNQHTEDIKNKSGDQVKEKETPPTDSSSAEWLRINNKDYSITVLKKGKNINLTAQQQEKIAKLVLEMVDKQEPKDLKLISVKAKVISNEKGELGKTDKKIFNQIKEVISNPSKKDDISINKPKSKNEIFVEEKPKFDATKPLPSPPNKGFIDPTKSKHLFLMESHSYTSAFFDRLMTKTLNENTKKELKNLKEQTLQDLVGKKGIYSNEAWLKEGVDKEEAKKNWSTSEEGVRQSKAKNLLNEAMYEGLSIIQNDPDFKGDISKLHKNVCVEIAEEKKSNVIDKETQKIDIKLNTVVKNDRGEDVNINIRTRQFGDNVIGSMERRDRNKDGKIYAVNSQTESFTFYTKSGKPVTTTKLRTGSFDIDGIKPNPGKYDAPIEKEALEKGSNKLKILGPGELKAHINHIRLGKDPQAFNDLLKMLNHCKMELPSIDPKGWDHAIEKFTHEFNIMVQDQAIIEANEECIKGVFDKVDENKKIGQKLGLNLPREVINILNTDEDFKDTKQNWGMISLQTPVNVGSDKGINKIILALAKKLPGPPKLLEYLNLLAGADTSELDPIYREMEGYKEAVKTSDKVKHGLYFNIPTNFIGADKTIIRLGPYQLSLPIKSLLNAGLVDKSRHQQVNAKTQESVQKVHDLAIKAQNLINQKLETLPPNSEQEKVLKRYLESLNSLLDQTFVIGVKDGKEVATLRPAVGADAQYETVGRLTTLMELLNFNTTGHCRSGNNRTAAWLAKSHQIVGIMASSEDGKIPPPKETAGTLAGKVMGGTLLGGMIDKLTKNLGIKVADHWSLDIFLSAFQTSLTLQQANKGTQGTKLNVGEIRNRHLRRAQMKGAFDLAGKFDQKLFDEANSNRLREENKILHEEHKSVFTAGGGRNTLNVDSYGGLSKVFKQITEQIQTAKSKKDIKQIEKQIDELKNIYTENKKNYDVGELRTLVTKGFKSVTSKLETKINESKKTRTNEIGRSTLSQLKTSLEVDKSEPNDEITGVLNENEKQLINGDTDMTTLTDSYIDPASGEVYGRDIVEEQPAVKNHLTSLQHTKSLLNERIDVLTNPNNPKYDGSIDSREELNSLNTQIKFCDWEIGKTEKLLKKETFISSNHVRDELAEKNRSNNKFGNVVKDIVLGAPVNFHYQKAELGEEGDKETVGGHFRVGVMAYHANTHTNLQELEELRKPENKEKLQDKILELQDKMISLEGLEKDQKKIQSYEFAISQLKDIDNAITERKFILRSQFLPLASGQVEKYFDKITDDQTTFSITHLGLLDPKKSKLDETGWMHSEGNQLADMEAVFKDFNGKKLIFDGKGPGIDAEGNIHLAQEKKDNAGNPKELKLETNLINISVQGSGVDKSRIEANKDLVKNLIKQAESKFPDGHEGIKLLNSVLARLEKESNLQLAEDIGFALTELDMPLSVGCLSAKDRTGFVSARIIFRHLAKDMPPDVAKRLAKTILYKTRNAAQIVKKNTARLVKVLKKFEELPTVLKLKSMHFPGFNLIDRASYAKKQLYSKTNS